MDTILKANAMCNLYGLDTISTGVRFRGPWNVLRKD